MSHTAPDSVLWASQRHCKLCFADVGSRALVLYYRKKCILRYSSIGLNLKHTQIYMQDPCVSLIIVLPPLYAEMMCVHLHDVIVANRDKYIFFLCFPYTHCRPHQTQAFLWASHFCLEDFISTWLNLERHVFFISRKSDQDWFYEYGSQYHQINRCCCVHTEHRQTVHNCKK